MDHEHSHHQADHGHAGHVHGPRRLSADADRRRLGTALALILGFMAAEVTVGILAHSLVLLSDAAHMLTDAAALGLSFAVTHLAARPARGAMTFGFARTEILSAQFNGATLLVLGLLVVYEGVHRLVTPAPVDGTAVLLVALAGIVVNLVSTRVLAGADRGSMNVEGSRRHIATDLAAFVLSAVAGAVIVLTGARRADGVASLIVAAIMLHAAYGLLRASGRVFLEAAPEGVDPDAIGRCLAGQPGVCEVHDLHVWEVTSGFPALSAHVLVREDSDCHAVTRRLRELLEREFRIAHTTLQVDHEHTRLLRIETPEPRR